ncbi:MAG: galactokinase [Clostridiales bacterium]|nr:galactokinase [Clostridiales bacterium]
MQIAQLKEKFVEIFGEGEARVFIGPARVNLIGEHIDYNGGNVFPCAISLRSACVARKRDDKIIRLASTSYPHIVTAEIDKLEEYKNLEWGNYQLGVAYCLMQDGHEICGMDMLFDETVPHASGLSSSAAIEMAMGMATAALSGFEVDGVRMAQIGQMAENNYVGMNCGIMDQFASRMGKKGSAILLNCGTLEYEYAPFNLEEKGLRLIIMNTKKPRSLITSAYNTRRAECEEALRELQEGCDCEFICDLTPEMFEELARLITKPTNVKRALHCVMENQRTKDAIAALNAGDIEAFGSLMVESHVSLRDLYEVSGIELDTMVEAALKQEGVLGARMTGAGFGGCALAIVKEECVDKFIENVGKEYNEKIGYVAEFYIAEIADGAGELVD